MVKKTKREKRTQINNINNRYSPINIEQLKIEAGENFWLGLGAGTLIGLAVALHLMRKEKTLKHII